MRGLDLTGIYLIHDSPCRAIDHAEHEDAHDDDLVGDVVWVHGAGSEESAGQEHATRETDAASDG